MVSKKVVLKNAMGFHMRPATGFANAMGKYPCDVILRVNGSDVNGKSLINIVASCIKCGTELEIVCNGDMEKEALDEAVAMIESGFGE